MKHFAIFLLLFMTSCRSEMPEIPKDVLSPDKMKLILVDIHMADALAETKAESGMSEKLLNNSYYNFIFKKHGISQSAFYTSYKFYEKNPVWMNRLYDDVLIEMSKQEEALSKQ